MDIKRLRKLRTGRTTTKGSEKAESKDLPLDHQLTFNPAYDEEWRYRNGHVFVNGEDADELINRNPRDISFLHGMNICLDRYQKHVWERGGQGRSKFNAAINSLQGKVVGRLGSIYDGLVGGVEYEFVDDVFWINNINVKAVVTLYSLRPTRKAREYLKGLRTKLFLIIARRQSNARVNGINGVIHELIGEIDDVLKAYIPTDTPLLVSDTRSLDEHAN